MCTAPGAVTKQTPLRTMKIMEIILGICIFLICDLYLVWHIELLMCSVKIKKRRRRVKEYIYYPASSARHVALGEMKDEQDLGRYDTTQFRNNSHESWYFFDQCLKP